MKRLSIPEWKLQEWDELTNSNAHGLRLYRIADYLIGLVENQNRKNDLVALAGMLNALNCQHDRLGHLPAWMHNIRCVMSERLTQIVVEEFGWDAKKLLDL